MVLAAGLGGLIWLDREGLTPRHPLAAALRAWGCGGPEKSLRWSISADAGHPMGFEMGLESAEEPWIGPVHEVRSPRPFAIGKHEVTFDEYELFAARRPGEVPTIRAGARATGR